MTTRFSAPDIECNGCANAIQKALSRAEGIAQVTVAVDAKTVTVEHDTDLCSVESIRTRLEHAGFPATVAGPLPLS